jgi:hypothetical protein
MANIPHEPKKRTDLYDLIEQQCTADQIRGFLHQWREESKEVHVSGKKEGLVQHLRDAAASKLIPRAEIIDFLRDCEENGDQYIYFFSPVTADARELCRNPDRIAKLLFKDLGKMGFPLFERVPESYIWSDFRKVGAKWTAKIYGHEVGLTLKGEGYEHGEFVKRYEPEEIRTTCLVIWDGSGQLQIRVPRGDYPQAKLDTRMAKVWSMLKPALSVEEFRPWNMRKIMRRMVEERGKNIDIYGPPIFRVRDSAFNPITFGEHVVPEFDQDDEEDEEDEETPEVGEKEAAIDIIMRGNGPCERLAVRWLAIGSEGQLKTDLRTIISSRAEHELIIPASVNSAAVEYVINQLRSFNR